MSSAAEQIRAWVEVAKKKNYYEILGLFPGAGEDILPKVLR